MDWNAPVEIYCERLGPGFWAEPVNAITNLAFLIAAAAAWIYAGRAGRREPLTVAMICFGAIVGVGSFLFHTFATRWSGLADTIPILWFILFYLYLTARRYLLLPVWASLAIPVAFIGFAIGFLRIWRMIAPSLNGSEGYFPVLVALIGFGALLAQRKHPVAPWLFAAAGVFAVSLTFRSLDQAVCSTIPLGVHYFWHCFNGLLFGVVMFAFIRHGAPARLAPCSGRG